MTELTIPDVKSLCGEISAKGALLTRDVRRLLDLRDASLERTGLKLVGAMDAVMRARLTRVEGLARGVEPE